MLMQEREIVSQDISVLTLFALADLKALPGNL